MIVAPRDESLTLTRLLWLARGRNADAEIVTALPGDEYTRSTSEAVVERASRVAGGLAQLGVGAGDRVASLSWNVAEHVELYWAVPGMGAVLHTLNPRLLAQQSADALRASQARVLVAHGDLVDLARDIAARAGCVEHLLVFHAREDAGATSYDDLVEAADPLAWPELSEHDAAALCFTSGTTGPPKGIVYTHRMLVLHALTMAAFDPYGSPGRDRVLAVVPMFHAMGWNLPFVAAVTGASLVLPGRDLQPHRLASLIVRERITFSCGVPTVWADLLDHADRASLDLDPLRTIACGGSRVPDSLMRRYDRRGITMLQGWGMTETGPGAARVYDVPELDNEIRWRRRGMTGWLRPFYEARVRGEDGELVPEDGTSTGEIEVRGPMVIREYFEGVGSERFVDGWLRTGDIGSIDPWGWLHLVDREKDVIKSGGEWISSLDLETAIRAHPGVADVAVIAIPDERWMERPLPCLVLEGEPAPLNLRGFLAGTVPSWWIPDRVAVVDRLPLTGVGKVDKAALRSRLAAGELVVSQETPDKEAQDRG